MIDCCHLTFRYLIAETSIDAKNSRSRSRPGRLVKAPGADAITRISNLFAKRLICRSFFKAHSGCAFSEGCEFYAGPQPLSTAAEDVYTALAFVGDIQCLLDRLFDLFGRHFDRPLRAQRLDSARTSAGTSTARRT